MLIGVCLLVTGISLILIHWASLVVVFKGVIGMILALAGLLVLMLIK